MTICFSILHNAKHKVKRFVKLISCIRCTMLAKMLTKFAWFTQVTSFIQFWSQFSSPQNPLRLVSDIVKGKFTDISPQYTAEMNSLVNVLLSQVSYWLFSYIVIFFFPIEAIRPAWPISRINRSTFNLPFATTPSISAFLYKYFKSANTYCNDCWKSHRGLYFIQPMHSHDKNDVIRFYRVSW